jgi:simple sugar transport system substrate-binding protein
MDIRAVGRRLPTTRLAARTGVLAAAVALAVAACSSSADSKPASASTHSASAGGLIIELNGPLSTEGFSQIKMGSDTAARELGINYEYSAPPNLNNFTADYTNLFREALARHPVAMVVGDFIPSAFDGLIRQATSSGIPVVIINNGESSWQKDGALTYVGPSYPGDGVAGADAARKAGVTDLLCVDQTTSPAVEQICTSAGQAMRSAGNKYYQLNVPLNDLGNPAQLTQDIQGFLSSHPQINGVFTAGSGFGTDAAAAVKNLGKTADIKVGGNEVTPTILQDVKNGAITWEVGVQPFLQGFDALQVAAQYVQYRINPTAPVITGGFIIDKANINQELAIQAKYPGLLG